jgi:hypothetical protein
MINHFIRFMGIVAFCCLNNEKIVMAQNLDRIGKKGMASVSGGLQTDLIANGTVNEQQFRDPFSWVLSGNIAVNFLDFSLPFSFSFSNTGKSFTQPFNMTAVHPKYKNWQAHLGITSMNLSPYTYQGLNYAGAGLEYKPKKWAFCAFGGRLKKAIEYNPEVDNINEVSYTRIGFGLGTGYKGKNFGTELILFKAYDNTSSLEFPHQNPELTAKDNLVISVNGEVSLWSALQLKLEIATSLLTRNIIADEDPDTQRKGYYSLINGNNTSMIRNAYNAFVNYRIKFFGIGVQYERIDPEYSTLGAVYFNNDLENITLNPTFSIAKGRVSIALSGGFQRNNLNKGNASDDRRWIGTATINAQIIKGLTWSINYSNMSSFSRKNPTADPFYTEIGDTMNYYQISQNASTSINYGFGKNIRQVFGLTGAYSRSENITGRLEDATAFGFNTDNTGTSTPADVYNGVFSHTIQLTKAKVSLGWTVNANHAVVQGNTNTYIGPGINASRPFLNKKMNVNVGATYNQQLTQGTLNNHVLNFRAGMRYAPDWWNKKFGKLSMGINASWTNKLSVQNLPNRQNITIIANISYQIQSNEK